MCVVSLSVWLCVCVCVCCSEQSVEAYLCANTHTHTHIHIFRVIVWMHWRLNWERRRRRRREKENIEERWRNYSFLVAVCERARVCCDYIIPNIFFIVVVVVVVVCSTTMCIERNIIIDFYINCVCLCGGVLIEEKKCDDALNKQRHALAFSTHSIA